MTGLRPTEPLPIPELFAPHVPPALQQINVPAYVLDQDGRIRWLNPAARAITGDVVGKMFTSVLEGDDARRARPIFERNVHGAPHPDYSVDLVGTDGRPTRVEISSVSLGTSHHAVGMFGLAVPAKEGRRGPPKLDARLTRRQREVLELLAEGASTDQIAEQLVVSRATVRNHIRHLLQRLGTRSRIEAIAVARRDGLI